MSPRSLALPLLLLVSLAGCPAPEDEAPPAPPPGGGEAPPPPGDAPSPPAGDAAPPPADGAAPPPTDGAPPPDAGPVMIGASPEGGSMVNPESLKFTRFITPDSKTVKLTVTVEGTGSGQIDITSITEKDGNKAPTVLHVEPFTAGTPVVITAPATYADALYVSALVRVEKGGKDEPPPPSGPPKAGARSFGGATDPVRLDGKDLAVTVKLGTVPPWLTEMEKMAMPPKPPDGAQKPAGPPPTPGAPAMPPAGAPGTPPPAAPNPTK